MGIQLNGWTKGVGPLNIKSHNDFNILYTATKNTITEVANKSKNINDDVTRLKEDIDKLKRIMSSTDFNKKNTDLITAIDEAISVLDEKQKKLYTSIAERYDRAAYDDAWFSAKADEYSGYIREKLLGENPKSNIGSGVDNSSNARAIVDDSKVDNLKSTNTSYGDSLSGMPQFGEDGLLIKQQSEAGQQVINRLFYEIPTHANGTHSAELDKMIDNLSTEECVWVLSRIENDAFGQTGAGYHSATPEAHQAFIEQQVIGRFGGDIHNLLKHWGTYSYSGY